MHAHKRLVILKRVKVFKYLTQPKSTLKLDKIQVDGYVFLLANT